MHIIAERKEREKISIYIRDALSFVWLGQQNCSTMHWTWPYICIYILCGCILNTNTVLYGMAGPKMNTKMHNNNGTTNEKRPRGQFVAWLCCALYCLPKYSVLQCPIAVSWSSSSAAAASASAGIPSCHRTVWTTFGHSYGYLVRYTQHRELVNDEHHKRTSSNDLSRINTLNCTRTHTAARDRSRWPLCARLCAWIKCQINRKRKRRQQEGRRWPTEPL